MAGTYNPLEMMMTTDATETKTSDTLLGKLAKMIAAQAAGTESGHAAADLNHAYMDLTRDAVCERSDALLAQVFGPDWRQEWLRDWDPRMQHDSEAQDRAQSLALAQSLDDIDPSDPREAVNTLASSLMVACRELGWLEASRAAHDQWFYAGGAP